MDNIIYPEKLEKLLLSKWAEILNINNLRFYVSHILDRKLGIKSPHDCGFSISRFEITNEGFLIWIEVTIKSTALDYTENQGNVNITIESFLSNSGQITNLRII